MPAFVVESAAESEALVVEGVPSGTVGVGKENEAGTGPASTGERHFVITEILGRI